MSSADGRSVFIKAASPAQNPDTPDMMRAEADINLQIRRRRAPAPRPLDRMDDGTWVVLIFEAVAGRNPGAPWSGLEVSSAELLAFVTGMSGYFEDASRRSAP